MRKFALILAASALLIVVLFGVWIYSRPERGTTGSVSTRFRLLGPNCGFRGKSLANPR